MADLIKGFEKFHEEIYHHKQGLFEKLAHHQEPQALFITCSDSRINPHLLTQTEPGDLFILRNAGNLVPPYGAAIGGTTATIEFGASVLQVKEIIVCGHTDCGAMKALVRPESLQDLPAVREWLRMAESTRQIVKEMYQELKSEELFVATIKENVLVQLEHLKTHPAVAKRLRMGNLTLHGWIYSIATGEVWLYDAHQEKFVFPKDVNKVKDA
ncbi:MAG: carbonic anhydrase [Nitrospirales bacterium]|nr:MAG: carbonic anhydrase [Nitrospirales bacterium]